MPPRASRQLTSLEKKEARRVKTPPMSGGSTPVGQPRGFFFDLTPPESRASSSNLSTGTYPPRRTHSKELRISPDWWDRDSDHPGRAAAEKGLAKKHQLEADMSLPPEHLPSSPLCPRNSKHKSKGRGICVYHGRRRSVSLRREDGAEDSGSYEYGWYRQ